MLITPESELYPPIAMFPLESKSNTVKVVVPLVPPVIYGMDEDVLSKQLAPLALYI